MSTLREELIRNGFAPSLMAEAPPEPLTDDELVALYDRYIDELLGRPEEPTMSEMAADASRLADLEKRCVGDRVPPLGSARSNAFWRARIAFENRFRSFLPTD